MGVQVNIINRLVEANADVNVADCKGKTPLMWAARQGSIQVLVDMLKAGAQTGFVDKAGMTVIEHAKVHHRPRVAEHMCSIIRKQAVHDKRHAEMRSACEDPRKVPLYL